MSSDNNSDNRNIGKVKEKPHSREQLLSIARKAESLGYDSLSINDHIVFRTSWLDALIALSAVASVTTAYGSAVLMSPILFPNTTGLIANLTKTKP